MAKFVTTEYKGGNSRLDALLAVHFPDTELYFVNGPYGRLPVEATSREEAEDLYKSTHKDRVRA